jgi:glycine oxidase
LRPFATARIPLQIARVNSTASEMIVIGGGIAGCAVAIELAGRGVDVTLIEAEQPGVRATGAAGGMLAPQYESSGPGPWFDLAVRARNEYAEFVRHVEALADWRIGYRTDGMLVANRTAAEEEAARAGLVWQVALGLKGAILDFQDAVELHAGISPDIRSWLWLPDEGQVDAQRLAVALGSAVRAAGAHLRHGERVVELLSAVGRITGVRTASGDMVHAGTVVLSAGAWSGTMAGLPSALAVRPVRGQMLRLRPKTIPGWPLVATHDARYLVPRENGTVLLGSTMEDVGFDDRVSERRLQLAEYAAALVPALADAPVVESWAGLRPMTPAGWPIVGPAPEIKGLFYNSGHSRNGILLAPLTARLIADQIEKA